MGQTSFFALKNRWNAAIYRYGGSELSEQNPYQAYLDDSLANQHPMRLVLALYEGALEAARQARHCLQVGDIWGRSKAVNKGMAILTELLVSLDFEKGGAISFNLKRLYSYMQTRLLEAHARQAKEPLSEVEKLLETLIEGWRGAKIESSMPVAERHESSAAFEAEPMPYGAYWSEPAEPALSGTAFSF